MPFPASELVQHCCKNTPSPKIFRNFALFMSNAPASPPPSLVPALLAAFIDLVGIGIIFPVLAPLFVGDSDFLPANFSEQDRKLAYGILIACFPLAQFIGSPLLGALSDRYGRKPLLSISLVGGMLGYFLFAIGLEAGLLWMIMVARSVAGFSAGNLSIVYSSVAEMSTQENRARNFGLIGMMAGLGFILGPALGSVLVNDKLVPWFGPSVPFWVSGILCGLNVILVRIMFKETLRERSDKPLDFLSGIRNLVKAFSMPGMTTLFSVVLLSTLGFAFFTQFFNVYMIEKFQYTQTDLGWIFSFIGLCIAIVQGLVMRPLSKRFKPEQILRLTYFGLGLALMGVLLPNAGWQMYLLVPLIALTQGLGFPNLSALVSANAPMSQQGEIMGINQSLGALGNALPPILGGVLAGVDDRLPMLVAAGVTLMAGLTFALFFKRK
jgi:MFS transporter, DHA1 family, tetracycline resistance protein